MQTTIQRIALTSGEPAGVGPDICLKLAQQAHHVELIIIADPEMLTARAAELGLPIRLLPYQAEAPRMPQQAGELKILPIQTAVRCRSRILDPANSPYVLNTITRAAQGSMSLEFDAMVTAPLHKGVINDAGTAFSGHTEWLADIAGGVQPVMLLAAPGLRVALATTHLPLSEVPKAITASHLQRILTILHQDLQSKFAIRNPTILVTGLNPHAGENGHLGREEIEIIEPALETLKASGMDLRGPLPADTLFTPKYLKQADAVLAMYHDQGLPVLKHMGFGKAVNITLGLPFIRTSVDHGTALDLAGTGQADASSLTAALQSAIELINLRQSAN